MSTERETIRILHVDDDPALAELTATRLEREDDRFTVDTASGVAEALEFLAQRRVDCIVSDFEMPGRNGIEFLELVREDHPELPFVLYTGRGSEAVASDAISAGVTDYLQKEGGAGQYAVLANRIGNAVDQYRARTALERSRDLLRHSEQLAGTGGWEFDVETGDLRWTAGTYEIHDVPPDEGFQPTPETAVEFFHPEDREVIQRAFRRCLDAGDPYDERLRLITAEDRRRWVRTTGEPVYEDEDVVAVRGAIQDVTERTERERELEGTNALLSTLVETLPVGVIAEDDDREVLAVNERLFDLFDIPGAPADVIGNDCERMAEAVADQFADPAGFVDRIDELIDRRQATDDEELRLRDGRTFLRSHRPIELPEGHGHLWVYRDVTAQENREQQLARYGETLEQLQRTTRRLLEASDADEACEVVIESIEEVLEFDVAAIWRTNDAGDRLVPVADTDTSEQLLAELPTYSAADESLSWDAFERGEMVAIDDLQDCPERHNPDTPIRSEFVVPLGEYGLINIGATETAAFDDRDRALVELWAGTITSAFARLERERELRDREEELVRERDRLAEFASIVSHDLRNPLDVANGRLALAREECDSEHLDAVARAHDRMNELIEDLLALARDGDHLSDLEPVPLGELAWRCWETVDAADATLQVDVERSIRADESRLQQLLENLMRNAIEHAGPDVTVTVGAIEDGFYVADDGPGIPEDERSAVFDTGYSTTRGGTGFGLSIVTQVADAHGWSIDLTEGADGGARFEITGVEFTAD